jgi:SRSO17 transposase
LSGSYAAGLINGDEYKFSLSNEDPSTSIERLAYMKGQRFFIEQSFKEAKNQVGFGDYQVRSWAGFHRHMALSMMALNLLMELKHNYNKDELEGITIPLLTNLLKKALPERHTTFEGHLHDTMKWLIIYRKQKTWANMKK